METPYDPDTFLLQLPMFSYLIEPGPRPGFLRDPESGRVFLPVWTDHDLFDTYLSRSGLAGRVSGLVIRSREELAAFLRMRPGDVVDLVIDPNPVAGQSLQLWPISDLLRQIG